MDHFKSTLVRDHRTFLIQTGPCKIHGPSHMVCDKPEQTNDSQATDQIHVPKKISPLLFNDVFFIIIVWRIKTIDLKISKWLFDFRNDFRRLNSTGSDGLSFIEIFYKYVQRNSPFIIGKDETIFNHI